MTKSERTKTAKHNADDRLMAAIAEYRKATKIEAEARKAYLPYRKVRNRIFGNARTSGRNLTFAENAEIDREEKRPGRRKTWGVFMSAIEARGRALNAVWRLRARTPQGIMEKLELLQQITGKYGEQNRIGNGEDERMLVYQRSDAPWLGSIIADLDKFIASGRRVVVEETIRNNGRTAIVLAKHLTRRAA
jgi:hypothetical protein